MNATLDKVIREEAHGETADGKGITDQRVCRVERLSQKAPGRSIYAEGGANTRLM